MGGGRGAVSDATSTELQANYPAGGAVNHLLDLSSRGDSTRRDEEGAEA